MQPPPPGRLSVPLWDEQSAKATSSASSRRVASAGWLAMLGAGSSQWSRCMASHQWAPCGVHPGDSSRMQRRHCATGLSTSRRQETRVLRRGLPEVAILGTVALAGVLGRPKSAPGPSQRTIQETKRLRAELEAAQKEDLEGKGGSRERLRRALRRVATVEAELEAGRADELEYPVPDYLKEAESSGKIMLAITGASGVGKSSLVNAFRRLRDSDSDAAETGVKETTMEPTMYSFSAREGVFNQRFYRQLQDDEKLKSGERVVLGKVEGKEGSCAEVLKVNDDSQNIEIRLEDGPVMDISVDHVAGTAVDVVIWDLPGVGSPNFPQATYLRRMGIRYFDVVLLITSTRFTEAELMLAEELRKFKVPFFMVRNKVDIDIDSEVLREEEALEGDEDEECELPKEERQKVAQQTINCIKSYFSSEYQLDTVYCVSSRRKLRGNHDFPSLEAEILKAIREQRS